jgi:IMP dehydrogenase
MQRGLTFDDVLLIPAYNDVPSRRDVDTSVQMGRWRLKIPILSANMDSITGPNMCSKLRYLGGMGILHRFMSIDENVQAVRQLGIPHGGYGVSLGISDGLARAAAVHEVGHTLFCVDVAHGHSKQVGNLIKSLKSNFADCYVIAGNVATYQGAMYLKDCGADAIKVGIGPGSVCSTRLKTGFGVPQITAIKDCARANTFIIADGGIRYPGDAVKCLAAGADVVMIGGLFAGCDETPGEVVEEFENLSSIDTYALGSCNVMHSKWCNGACLGKDKAKFKIFRGMASKEVQDEFHGGMPEYKAAEGISVKVPCKGPIKTVIDDLMGGIRSGMTYCGAGTLRELRHRAEFIEITANGFKESTPHYGR